MHEQTGHDAMIEQRGFVKPWPLWVRVLIKACILLAMTVVFVTVLVLMVWTIEAAGPIPVLSVIGLVVYLFVGWLWETD